MIAPLPCTAAAAILLRWTHFWLLSACICFHFTELKWHSLNWPTFFIPKQPCAQMNQFSWCFLCFKSLLFPSLPLCKILNSTKNHVILSSPFSPHFFLIPPWLWAPHCSEVVSPFVQALRVTVPGSYTDTTSPLNLVGKADFLNRRLL